MVRFNCNSNCRDAMVPYRLSPEDGGVRIRVFVSVNNWLLGRRYITAISF